MYSYSYYDYGMNSSQMAAFWGVYSVFMIAFAVFSIICFWKLFKKAGVPGWHSIIPFLNMYDLVRISWRKKKAKTTLTLTIIAIALCIIGLIVIVIFLGAGFGLAVGRGLSRRSDLFSGLATGGIGILIGALIYVAAMIISVIAAIYNVIGVVKLGKAFGKSGGFGVGLFFLTPIFVAILAFGSAEYIGNDDMREQQAYGGPGAGFRQQPYQQPNPQYNQIPPQQFDRQVPPQQPQTGGFCPACGKPYQPGTKFCSGCGNQLM